MRNDWNRWIPRVERAEVGLVGSLSLLHLLIILAFTLSRIARDGLFLGNLPASALPYVYLGLAGWAALVTHLFGRATARMPTHRALAGALVATAASLLVFAGWFALAPRVAAIAFYLWSGAYALLLVSQFWLLANERVNPRQARRLFGLIGAGGILGGMGGGVIASVIGRMLPAQALLALVAAVHVAAAVLARGAGVRGEEAPPAAPGRQSAPDAAEALRTAQRRSSSQYERILVLLFLAGGITSGVLDYQFKLALQQRYHGAGPLTAALGAFYGAQNLVALVAQIALAGSLLARFGARRSSILLPAGLLVGSTATAVWPGFAAVLSTRLYEAVMRVSIARSAWEFLYFPLEDDRRRKLKRFVDAVVSRGSEALAGLLILGLNLGMGGDLRRLAWLLLALAAGWLGVEVWMNRRYGRQLGASLQQMLALGKRPSITLEEAGAVDELLPLLDSDNEGHVLYALEALDALDPPALRERAEQLLTHPSATVRARALSLASLREAGRDALARWRGEAGDPRAPVSLDALVERDASERAVIAAAAGHEGVSEDERRQLAVLLEDADPQVRQIALQSAAASGSRELVPLLIRKLAKGGDRRAAREALRTYGARIVGTLGDYLVDREAPLLARRELPRVLAGVADQDAANQLMRTAHIRHDAQMLLEVLKALDRVREVRPDVVFPAADVERELRGDVELFARWAAQRRAVGAVVASPARTLLLRVLGERVAQARERIFRRLALLYPPRDLLLAHTGIISSNARLRAQALEVLDTMLTVEHRQVVRPLLDDAVPRAGGPTSSALFTADASSLIETLRELVASEDRWVQAAALYAVGELRLFPLREAAQRIAEQSTDATVLETAGWAVQQLTV